MSSVTLTRKALKELKSLDPITRERVLQALKQLEDFPFVRLDIKRLAGKRNHYRLRVGRIRVLFYYEKGKVIVYAVRPRESAY